MTTSNLNKPQSRVNLVTAAIRTIVTTTAETERKSAADYFNVVAEFAPAWSADDQKALMATYRKEMKESNSAVAKSAYKRASEFGSLLVWYYQQAGAESWQALIVDAPSYNDVLGIIREERKAEKAADRASKDSENIRASIAQALAAIGDIPQVQAMNIDAAVAKVQSKARHDALVKSATASIVRVFLQLPDVVVIEVQQACNAALAAARHEQLANDRVAAMAEDSERTINAAAAARQLVRDNVASIVPTESRSAIDAAIAEGKIKAA